MNKLEKQVIIRKLTLDEQIPYDLLLDADPSRDMVDNYLPVSEIYIALLDDELAGVYVLYPVDTDTLEIKNIAVREDLQGKGIGTLLLRDAEKRAQATQFRRMIIGTSNASIAQLYLYQKAGFEIAGIKTNFFTENYSGELYENGIQVKHMIMLEKEIGS